MGIQGLLPMLKDIQRPIHVKEWKGKTLAVDAYVWLHRGAYGCAEDLAQGKPTVQYVNYSMHRVRMLKHFGITPFIVFDGGLLPSKMGTEGDREKKRSDALKKGNAFLAEGQKGLARDCFVKGVDVTPEMAYQLIKYIVAPYEADPQLAYLERNGFVDGIITEDSDLLVFGCRNVLFKLDGDGNCVHVARDQFSRCREYDFSGWTDKEFRQMAILSGCDYVDSIVGLGLKTAYRLMRKYKTAEKVIQFVRLAGQHKVPIDYLKDFQRAELTFCHQRVFDPESKKLVHLEHLPAGVEADFMPFVGAAMDDDFARGLALGDIDPLSRNSMIDIAPNKFEASQVRTSSTVFSSARANTSNSKASYKPTPFYSKKPKATTSATPISGAGSILSFFKPSSQPTPSAAAKGKGRLPKSISLPAIAKRSTLLASFASNGNLARAKKENEDRGPVVAKSKFFGGGGSGSRSGSGSGSSEEVEEEFPDDEGFDYDAVEREQEDDSGLDLDGEEYLREIELAEVHAAEKGMQPSPPLKHKREPSITSSFDGVSSPPPSSPPRKRRRIDEQDEEERYGGESMDVVEEDGSSSRLDDFGISSPPADDGVHDGVLSSPPIPMPAKKIKVESKITVKEERIVPKKKKIAPPPSSDPIIFSESPEPDEQATPRAAPKRRNAVLASVRKEKGVGKKKGDEDGEEIDEKTLDVAAGWRAKFLLKSGTHSSPLGLSSASSKILPKPSFFAASSPALSTRNKPSPLPLGKSSVSKPRATPPQQRLPLSPRKVNTMPRPSRDVFVDDDSTKTVTNATLLAFRYTGPDESY
ncbi:exonuclease 1, partial [Phenoliferia sp. Uapishka_3]